LATAVLVCHSLWKKKKRGGREKRVPSLSDPIANLREGIKSEKGGGERAAFWKVPSKKKNGTKGEKLGS